METRANYALVGLFTLAVIGAAFAFVFWFRGISQNGERATYRIVFTGSVSGLTKGSVVRFNGLRVGEVTEITLIPNDPSRVAAVVEVDRATPVKLDTKARLEYQGLTGVAGVQLTGGTAEAAPLTSADPRDTPTIFADRSDFQDILETVQRLSSRVDSVIGRAESLIGNAEGPIVNTARNAEAFTKVLADNSSNVSQLLSSGAEMTQRIGNLAQRLERFTDEAEALVRSVDAQSINRTILNAERTSAALANRSGEIEAVIADAATLTRRLTDPQGPLEATLQNAETFSRALADNAGRVETIGRSVEEAANRIASLSGRAEGVVTEAERIARSIDGESLGRTIQNAEKVSETLALSREQFQTLISDAAALARRLNQSAAGLDTTLADISALVKAVDTTRLNRTIENADRFAQTLGDNTASIDRALKDASEITAKVNSASDRLDRVLAGAENLFADGAGKGVIAEIGETAKAIRVLAENLDRRTSEITTGINRFTGSGARELEALAGDARRAVGDISRAVRNLERNPSQIITGGRSSIPEYGGRR